MVEEGMVITTNSQRVEDSIKNKLSVLLDSHEFKCGPCKRRETCEFLKLIIKHKARASKPFIVTSKTEYIDDRSKSLVIDRTKCVKCGRCIGACEKKTGTCTIQFVQKGQDKVIGTEELKCFDETNCLLCGQCVAACPVDALSEKTMDHFQCLHHKYVK